MKILISNGTDVNLKNGSGKDRWVAALCPGCCHTCFTRLVPKGFDLMQYSIAPVDSAEGREWDPTGKMATTAPAYSSVPLFNGVFMGSLF